MSLEIWFKGKGFYCRENLHFVENTIMINLPVFQTVIALIKTLQTNSTYRVKILAVYYA